MIMIHNSLTGRKEKLEPVEPGHVRMYVCGMTVYDYCHLGHARAQLVFDVVARYLRWRGYRVTYVRNITDIDDKIIKRAAENGESVDDLTGRFIGFMHEDFDALGMDRPDLEPRATEHMTEIIRMISALIDNGHAYEGANGDVYYRVSSFAPYGRLSGKRPAELRVGARIGVDEAKEDPLDFALWKAAKPGEPRWDSPWGPGRPGWHIECSAMSTAALGNHFDIHGGGMDLKFPHHENEIAQSCGASHEPFVNIWMHNGFVQVADEKMSKSLGNFFTIREILKTHRAEVVRYFVLSRHYRSPLNYTEEDLVQTRAALDRLYTALRGVPADGAPDEGVLERFRQVMDDDFNTAEGLATMQECASALNRAKAADDPERTTALAAALLEMGAVTGLLREEPESWFKRADGKARSRDAGVQPGAQTADGLTDEAIERLIEARKEARGRKDWAEADRIRDELAQAGVILEDGAGETTWRRG
ncbi:MAG: cysteine--tRNA ligase [Gammaproteobacteria bacterium]|jgi:cysteinyl-tRNA synthetase